MIDNYRNNRMKSYCFQSLYDRTVQTKQIQNNLMDPRNAFILYKFMKNVGFDQDDQNVQIHKNIQNVQSHKNI